MTKLEIKDKAIKPIRKVRQWMLSPKKIVLIVFILFLVLVGFYFWREIKFLTRPPQIEIIQPPVDITVREETFEIIGKTDPSAYLTINNQEVYIDNQGNFKYQINLSKGINVIEIQAKNRFDKTNEIIRRIIYEK